MKSSCFSPQNILFLSHPFQYNQAMKFPKFHFNLTTFLSSYSLTVLKSYRPIFLRSYRLTVISSISLLLSTSLYAQNEANIWYFGNHCGMDFNSGIPVVIHDGQTTEIYVSGTITA